jgi:DNA polymerase-1
MPPVTILLDADSFAYEHAFRNSGTFEWDNGAVSHSSDLSIAKDELRTRIEEVRVQLKADDVVVALTDYEHPNFRKAFYAGYKANRSEKPAMLHELRAWLVTNYRSYIRPHLEADDVVGILATHTKLIPGKKIVVSIDKDLQCVPCWLFNPAKDKKPQKVTKDEADLFHLMQTLTGDPVDTYPGCPGIGPKKAAAALNGVAPKDRWTVVVKLFESRGLSEEDALVQARCARILRASDYNFAKKEVILWTP